MQDHLRPTDAIPSSSTGLLRAALNSLAVYIGMRSQVL
jgi:hypothetical protein